MVLNVCALLLVLGITFLNSIFGLFSGLINAFCAVVAAVVSLGYFEALNELVTRQLGLSASYSEPACLVVLFVASLTLLRVLADKFIRGNVRVPMWLDWGGGALAGFLIGQICVGILLLGAMMLPLGGRVLQFQRLQRDPDNTLDQRGYVEFAQRRIWLRCDEFVSGLVSLLSRGSLAGKTTLASVYPDFPQWVAWTGNTVQPESITAPRRDEKADGFGQKGLRVLRWWLVRGGLEGRYRKQLPTRSHPDPPYSRLTYRPAPGRKLIGLRLELARAAADLQGRYHRFRPTMIRLVGKAGPQPQHYPARLIGGADPKIGDALRIADADNNFAVPAAAQTPLDVYFEVDEHFSPRFVEYRRHARAPLPPEPGEPPAQRLAAAGSGRRAAGRARASGATRFIDALVRPYGDVVDLPFEMSAARVRGAGATISGQKLVSGRIAGARDRLERSGREPKVAQFQVPAGYRLCQIRFKPARARTLVGQVFNFVAARVNQYKAVDNAGNEYFLDGYFALVPRGGKQYLELFFTGDPEDPAFRAMLDFKQIKPSELQAPDAQLCLLFLVPPGSTIRSIENQKGEGIHGLHIKVRSR